MTNEHLRPLLDSTMMPMDLVFTRVKGQMRLYVCHQILVKMSTSMEGKTVVIASSTGGIGFHSTQEIARLGARGIFVGRNETLGDAAEEKFKQETGNAMIKRIIGCTSTPGTPNMCVHGSS